MFTLPGIVFGYLMGWQGCLVAYRKQNNPISGWIFANGTGKAADPNKMPSARVPSRPLAVYGGCAMLETGTGREAEPRVQAE
jgi:hypothetical protein